MTSLLLFFFAFTIVTQTGSFFLSTCNISYFMWVLSVVVRDDACCQAMARSQLDDSWLHVQNWPTLGPRRGLIQQSRVTHLVLRTAFCRFLLRPTLCRLLLRMTLCRLLLRMTLCRFLLRMTLCRFLLRMTLCRLLAPCPKPNPESKLTKSREPISIHLRQQMKKNSATFCG